MSRLTGFSGREVARVARLQGWTPSRTRGSHMTYERAGDPLNLTIPDHSSVKEGTLRRLLTIMDMTIEEFLAAARK